MFQGQGGKGQVEKGRDEPDRGCSMCKGQEIESMSGTVSSWIRSYRKTE